LIDGRQNDLACILDCHTDCIFGKTLCVVDPINIQKVNFPEADFPRVREYAAEGSSRKAK
jgi:hypothetical protein